TDASLRDLRLSWLPKPSLDIQSTAPLSVPALAPRADYVWTLAIKPAPAPAAPGAAGPSAIVRPGGGAEAGFFTTMAPCLGQQGTQIDENLDLRLDYVTV